MSRLNPTMNLCFPRSGHRFLRNICQAYFGKDMVFKSVHNKYHRSIDNANYIKNHDFGVIRDITVSPNEHMQYLIQYRHPLESAQSYFDFRVHHDVIEDSADSWAEFLPFALDYWKAFVTKWCLDDSLPEGLRIHLVRYDNLSTDTRGSAEDVISFLTGGAEVDQERLAQAIEQFNSGFGRYVEDQVKGERLQKKSRDLTDFRYFDNSMYQLEESLTQSFLAPLGIGPLLGSVRRQPL